MNALKTATVAAIVAVVVSGAVWLQFRIIHDCGLMGLLRDAEWWWLFGYCK